MQGLNVEKTKELLDDIRSLGDNVPKNIKYLMYEQIELRLTIETYGYYEFMAENCNIPIKGMEESLKGGSIENPDGEDFLG